MYANVLMEGPFIVTTDCTADELSQLKTLYSIFDRCKIKKAITIPFLWCDG